MIRHRSIADLQIFLVEQHQKPEYLLGQGLVSGVYDPKLFALVSVYDQLIGY